MKDCVNNIGIGCAKECAAIGWSNLVKAVLKPPIQELEVEKLAINSVDNVVVADELSESEPEDEVLDQA